MLFKDDGSDYTRGSRLQSEVRGGLSRDRKRSSEDPRMRRPGGSVATVFNRPACPDHRLVDEHSTGLGDLGTSSEGWRWEWGELRENNSECAQGSRVGISILLSIACIFSVGSRYSSNLLCLPVTFADDDLQAKRCSTFC